MMNIIKRVAVVLLAVGCLLSMASSAEAASSGWKRTTTGATGSGTYSRSHNTYHLTYKVTDTKSDGHCAYVVFRPEVYWTTKVTGWTSVGWTGYELRHEVCGYHKQISGSNNIDVWAHMSAVDKQAATKMRMRIKVCREVKGIHRDNCSELTTPPVNL